MVPVPPVSLISGKSGSQPMLSQRLLPVRHEQFPNRGLIEGQPPEKPCAVFPGIHRVRISEDGGQLTVCVEP